MLSKGDTVLVIKPPSHYLHSEYPFSSVLPAYINKSFIMYIIGILFRIFNRGQKRNAIYANK